MMSVWHRAGVDTTKIVSKMGSVIVYPEPDVGLVFGSDVMEVHSTSFGGMNVKDVLGFVGCAKTVNPEARALLIRKRMVAMG